MPDAEVSQNVVLAIIATPFLAALVDVVKNFGPEWLNRGMLPALLAELGGMVFGVVAWLTYPVLYGGAKPGAPLAFYLGAGFALGVGAVGVHAQYKAGTQRDADRAADRPVSDDGDSAMRRRR